MKKLSKEKIKFRIFSPKLFFFFFILKNKNAKKPEKQWPDVLLTVIPKKISAEVSQDNKRKYRDRIIGSSNRMQCMNKI